MSAPASQRSGAPRHDLNAVLLRSGIAEAALIAARAAAAVATGAPSASVEAIEAGLRTLRSATVEAIANWRALRPDEETQ